MFIRCFDVRNFKSYKAACVDLYPVTVFVGSNNGGKSAFFDALLNFSMVSRGRLSQAFGPGPFSFPAVYHHGASPNSRIRFEAVLSDSAESEETLVYRVGYNVRKPLGDPPAYVIHDERLTRDGQPLFDRADMEECEIPGVIKHIGDEQSFFAAVRRAQVAGDYVEVDPLVTRITREISHMNKFRLVPDNLSRPARLPDINPDSPEESRAPRLDYAGEELAGVLYYLDSIDSPVLNEIVKRLEDAIDGFAGFDFNRAGNDRIGFSARFDDDRGVVAAANLSQGTLSLIGILTLLLSPTRPPVLILEEPENGLTPRSTRVVYETIVDISKTGASPETQVLISSHSPFVIVEAWNGNERDFIYKVKVIDGGSSVKTFAEVSEAAGGMLGKIDGKREHLSLNHAELLMDGYR